MTAQTMHRHQKRLMTTMLAHTTTLIPLHNSAHWFLTAIDTTTMTIITFHNSAGTYGQQAWKPILRRWLRQHIPESWQVIQGTSPSQPGGTECGTHSHQHDGIHTQPHTSGHIKHPVEPQYEDTHSQPHCPRRVHLTHTGHRDLSRSRNHTQPHTVTSSTHPTHAATHTITLARN